MTAPAVVFLFDVDNTLLDNDQVTSDLRDHLTLRISAPPNKNATGHYLKNCGKSSVMPTISAPCSATGRRIRVIPIFSRYHFTFWPIPSRSVSILALWR